MSDVRNGVLLTAVETYRGERIAVLRFKDGDRGWSEMRIEREQRDGSWSPTGTRISIPNQAVFLIRDAMDRSCQLAHGDRK